jgi:hypothetical protein
MTRDLAALVVVAAFIATIIVWMPWIALHLSTPAIACC